MSFTAASIRQSRVTAVMITVLLLAGVSAYLEMPKQMDPGFLVRNAQIVTYFPGASPERVEMLVTDPIEQSLQAIPQLDFLKSISRTGVSIIIVAIREEFTELRPIWDDMRRKVDGVRGQLPTGITGPLINDELGDVFPMLYTMTGDGIAQRELGEIADDIRDELLRIKGVAKVELLGEQDERIFVEYSNARLAQLGLSPGALLNILQARNIILPGGEVEIGPESIPLEPSGNFGSVEELGETLVGLPEGGVVNLKDITTIRREYIDPPRGLVRSGGRAGITFAISKADGANLLALGERVDSYFASLPGYYPHGIDFVRSYFQPVDVAQKVQEFTGSVYQAIGIVLLVMLLTLGLRTGLIVSSLIPAAMVIAIWVLSLLGESINQMSLASLIIALGLLVDNAIVVSELIMVRMGAGQKPFDAAVSSCRELQMPLLVSSLTTSAAFLPIYLAESAVGEYTGILFVVVTITLLVSWLLALSFTPLLCTWFLRPAPQNTEDSFDSGFYRAYRATLGWVLSHRVIALGIVILTFAGSLPMWGLVPQLFFPAQDRPFFMAEFSLPPGTSIKTTRAMVRQIDAFVENELKAKPEAEGVTAWTSFVGETPPSFTLGYTPSPSLGGFSEFMFQTSSLGAIPELMDRLQRYALDNFPDVKTYIRMLASGPPVDKPVQVRLSGPDTSRLFKIADTVKEQLSKLEGVREIGDDWGPKVKKFEVDIDSARAGRAGLANDDVALALQTFVSGLETTRYREDDESIPVVLRSSEVARRDLDRVRNLSVFSPRRPQSVPLSQVASLVPAWENSAILRRDRSRTVTVEASVAPGTTAIAVFDQIRSWLNAQLPNWGMGYRWNFGGEFETSVKANASIGDKLPIAGLVIILLLVFQFNSLRKPIIVLSAIVLGLIGVVIGLVVMDSYFGFMTLLGVVSLAGIVINNAIVLLDRIELEIDEGSHPFQAVMNAAQQRVRPILLTTATTVASLIPLYISGGSMWEPMAVSIMFGLVFSTVLTLLVVPLLYAMLYRIPNVQAG